MGLKRRRSRPAKQERKATKSRKRYRSAEGIFGLPSASRNVSDRRKVKKEAATFRTPHGQVISGMDVYDVANIVDPTAATKEITYESLDPLKDNLNLAQTYLSEAIRGAIHDRSQTELRKGLGYVRRLCKAVIGLCDLALGDPDE